MTEAPDDDWTPNEAVTGGNDGVVREKGVEDVVVEDGSSDEDFDDFIDVAEPKGSSSSSKTLQPQKHLWAAVETKV